MKLFIEIISEKMGYRPQTSNINYLCLTIEHICHEVIRCKIKREKNRNITNHFLGCTYLQPELCNFYIPYLLMLEIA